MPKDETPARNWRNYRGIPRRAGANANKTLARKAAEQRGRRAEFFAELLLRLKWYRIIGRRVRSRAGEIDLIALAPSGIICFIEVKARKDEGSAATSLGHRQLGRIANAAALFLAQRPELGAKGIRYDVILHAPGRIPKHVRDAWRPQAF